MDSDEKNHIQNSNKDNTEQITKCERCEKFEGCEKGCEEGCDGPTDNLGRISICETGNDNKSSLHIGISDSCDNSNNDYNVWCDDDTHNSRNLSEDVEMNMNVNSDDIFDKVIGYYEPSKNTNDENVKPAESTKSVEPIEPVKPKKKKKNKKPKNVSYEQDEYDMGYDDTYDSYYD